MKILFSNPAYIVLLVTFGIGLGVFNVVTTLLGQIVEAVRFTEVRFPIRFSLARTMQVILDSFLLVLDS